LALIESEIDKKSKEDIKANVTFSSTWIYDIAKKIIHLSKDLSHGLDEGTADMDDNGGFLALSLAVRNMPTSVVIKDDKSGFEEHHVNHFSAAIQAIMAEESLKIYLNEVHVGEKEWEERLDKIYAKRKLELKKNDEDCMENFYSKIKYRIIMSAEAALDVIISKGDIITRNGPLFYAFIDTTRSCVAVGVTLFGACVSTNEGDKNNGSSSSTSNAGVYGCASDANVMCASFETMENQCLAVKSVVLSVFSNPHLRRVKESLVELIVWFRHCKVEASRMAGHLGPKTQQSLQNWLGAVNDSQGNDSQNQLGAESQESLFSLPIELNGFDIKESQDFEDSQNTQFL